MANPTFLEETPLSLSEVKGHLASIEKRDEEMSYLSNKCKEYLVNFPILDHKQQAQIVKKLQDLNLTRLKMEYIMKISDFLPKTVDDLKVVLLQYPVSLPKKDQEAIIGVVKDFTV